MWLVTGGAGYIGSHVVRELEKSGSDYLVLDNLSTGVAKRIKNTGNFLELDIRDSNSLESLFQDYAIEGIIHLAGLKFPEESTQFPDLYFETNFEATKNLIDLSIRNEIKKFVFSSSSSVYGNQKKEKFDESLTPSPMSPYGESKLLAEDYLTKRKKAGDILGISLRYFNVVGAASEECADTSSRNLFPLLHRAFSANSAVDVFGNDYETPDGTCIRDYIHVIDVARMHIDILQVLEKTSDTILNLGSGNGYSVLNIIEEFAKFYGYYPEINWKPRRNGDPASVICDVEKLQLEYGWFTQFGLSDMVKENY
jgi:UDP-glucose 4-epimerase